MQDKIIVLTSALENSVTEANSRPSLYGWVLHMHWAHLHANRQITSRELATNSAKGQLKDEDEQHCYMAGQSTRFCDLATSLCTAK